MRRFSYLFPLLGILFLPLPSAGQARAEETRPLGTWERVLTKGTVTLRIEADRLQISTVDGGLAEVATLDAEFSITKDCVIYGIVYGVKAENGDLTEKLVDQPFSFRFRIDDNVLTIKDVKGFGDSKPQELAGRFTRVDKKTTAAVKPTAPPAEKKTTTVAKPTAPPSTDDVKRYATTTAPTGAEPTAPSVGVKESRSKD